MRRRELWWRNLVLALRRSRMDWRSRQHVGRLMFVLLYVIGYCFYLKQMYRESGRWGLEFGGVTLFLGVAVAFFIRGRNESQGSALLKLSARPSPGEDDLKEHRRRIVAELLGVAAMCDRAAVESLAREGKISEGRRGVGRQRALAVGRLEFVWEQLAELKRNLLIADEGSWTWDETWPWIVRVEDVRVMRWVIGMDAVLRPFEFLKADLSPVFRTTTHAEETNGERCLAAYDLRPAQTIAMAMVNRCAAEGVLRGDFSEEDEAVRGELIFMAERMRADESSDFLIGGKTVGKATGTDLGWVGQAAVLRMVVLGALIDYLNGPAEGVLRIDGVGGG